MGKAAIKIKTGTLRRVINNDSLTLHLKMNEEENSSLVLSKGKKKASKQRWSNYFLSVPCC